MIVGNLDGWVVVDIPEPVIDEVVDETIETEETTEETTTNNYVDPFMTSEEAAEKPNKKITDAECKLFYEEALDQSYMHTNRLNIDDLTPVEARVFIRGVCKWAASNLWNKYNIRVNNEDMEDTYIQSYGGLLYKAALKTLNQFINQRVVGISSFKEETETTDDNIWIM
jgi:hypothetical protein